VPSALSPQRKLVNGVRKGPQQQHVIKKGGAHFLAVWEVGSQRSEERNGRTAGGEQLRSRSDRI